MLLLQIFLHIHNSIWTNSSTQMLLLEDWCCLLIFFILCHTHNRILNRGHWLNLRFGQILPIFHIETLFIIQHPRILGVLLLFWLYLLFHHLPRPILVLIRPFFQLHEMINIHTPSMSQLSLSWYFSNFLIDLFHVLFLKLNIEFL